MSSTTRGTTASWRAAVPVLCALSFLLPARADAACGKGEKEKIENLKKAGIGAYDDLDMEAAKGSFKKAIDVATKAGCVHKSVAKVYLRLGVIHKVADLDDGAAINAFKKALALDPEAELDRDVSTPEVESVLKKARAGMEKTAPPDDPDGDSDPDPDPTPPVKTKPSKAIDEKNLACFAMREGAASPCVDPELELKVTCESAADLNSATLNYRIDAGPWVPNEMVGAGGYFGTTVSGASIRGKKVEFYVDATDPKAKRVAWAGTSEGPYGVKIGCKKVVLDDPPPDDPKPKKTKGDSGSAGDGDVSLDEEDPLGDGEEDDDDDDKPTKPKGPSKPLGRLFSFYLNLGTGLGLSTGGSYTQINGAMVESGTMWAPLHTEPEIAFHLPLKGPIGISVGAYGRLQLSPIFTWQAGLRGRVFKPLGAKASLVFNLAFAFGPTCKSEMIMMTSSGCRGGVGYLIATPTFPMNPLDYVLIGPFSASLGIGFQFDFTRNVGFYAGIDLGAFFGGTGFDNLGSPLPFAFQPHAEVNAGVRFGN